MMSVLRGDNNDRVPFAQYSNITATNSEIWESIGRSNMGIIVWSRVHEIVTPHCSVQKYPVEKDGLRGEQTVLCTPEGHLTQVKMFDPVLHSAATTEHFVKSLDDYEKACSYLNDCVVQDRFDIFQTDDNIVGVDGIAFATLPRTPFQQLWVEWVSFENLILHQYDSPEKIELCLDEMMRIARDVFKVVSHAPINTFVNVPDNITAPILGKELFTKHCIPFYGMLNEYLDGRLPIFVHMDGDLKAFRDIIGNSPVKGIDSFSPQPDNDTSIAEARAAWPSMRLWTNFPSSVHLRSEKEIYDEAIRILTEDNNSGMLQLQISENVPPGIWRKSYPQIVKAINDFYGST